MRPVMRRRSMQETRTRRRDAVAIGRREARVGLRKSAIYAGKPGGTCLPCLKLGLLVDLALKRRSTPGLPSASQRTAQGVTMWAEYPFHAGRAAVRRRSLTRMARPPFRRASTVTAGDSRRSRDPGVLSVWSVASGAELARSRWPSDEAGRAPAHRTLTAMHSAESPRTPRNGAHRPHRRARQGAGKQARAPLDHIGRAASRVAPTWPGSCRPLTVPPFAASRR